MGGCNFFDTAQTLVCHIKNINSVLAGLIAAKNDCLFSDRTVATEAGCIGNQLRVIYIKEAPSLIVHSIRRGQVGDSWRRCIVAQPRPVKDVLPLPQPNHRHSYQNSGQKKFYASFSSHCLSSIPSTPLSLSPFSLMLAFS